MSIKFIENTGDIFQKILNNALRVVSEVGVNINSYEELTARAELIEKNSKKTPKITTSYTHKNHDAWIKKELQKSSAMFSLAHQIDKWISMIIKKSDGRVVYGDGKLYFDLEYAKKCLGLTKKEEIYCSGGFGIGGTSEFLVETGRRANELEFISILDTINRYYEKGVINYTSTPVLVFGNDEYSLKHDYFSLAMIMESIIPNIPKKTYLGEVNDSQLEWFVNKKLWYDSYCPISNTLTFNPKHFSNMLKSVSVGNNLCITSMPYYPYSGNSPYVILTIALAEFIASLVCCMVINPNVKYMSGVMPAVMKCNGTSDVDLQSSWLLNASFGKIMNILGIDSCSSSGAVTNEVSLTKKSVNDTKLAIDFFETYAPDVPVRHIIGHLALQYFSLSKLIIDSEYVLKRRGKYYKKKKLVFPLEDVNVLELLLSSDTNAWSMRVMPSQLPVAKILEDWKTVVFSK